MQTLSTLFKTTSNEELGALVREYIAEAEHNSWDGFERWHRTGINALLRDMFVYYTNLPPESLPIHEKSKDYTLGAGNDYVGPES